jgi:hypothetical protein
MSDIAGAAAPVAGGGDGGPAAPTVAMESYADAATGRLAALKADRAFGARRLAKDAEATNLHATLMQLAYGERSEADQAALAESIGLLRRSTMAAAEKAQAAANAAAEVTRVTLPYEVAKGLTPEQSADLGARMAEWAGSLGLPPSTTRTVLDRITQMGPRLSRLSPEDHARWLDRQNVILDRLAKSKELADEWRATAKAVFNRSEFFSEMPVLQDAAIVRHLVNGVAYIKQKGS